MFGKGSEENAILRGSIVRIRGFISYLELIYERYIGESNKKIEKQYH